MSDQEFLRLLLYGGLTLGAGAIFLAAVIMASNRRNSLQALGEARQVAADTTKRMDRFSERMDRMEQQLLRIILRLFGAEKPGAGGGGNDESGA